MREFRTSDYVTKINKAVIDKYSKLSTDEVSNIEGWFETSQFEISINDNITLMFRIIVKKIDGQKQIVASGKAKTNDLRMETYSNMFDILYALNYECNGSDKECIEGYFNDVILSQLSIGASYIPVSENNGGFRGKGKSRRNKKVTKSRKTNSKKVKKMTRKSRKH
jgi:hypothetical protein